MTTTEKLIDLIKENPKLPVVPMVHYEVIGDDYEVIGDDCGYWMGRIDSVRIDEYLIDSLGEQSLNWNDYEVSISARKYSKNNQVPCTVVYRNLDQDNWDAYTEEVWSSIEDF